MNLIKIPFSGAGLGHGNGANAAPDAIIEQFKELFTNEQGLNPNFEIDSISVDESNIGDSHKSIETYCETIKDKSIFLGGDHSITHPVVKGFKKSLVDRGLDPELLFIVFDAHPDLMDDFRPPTQEDYLRVLIEDGTLKSKNVVLIGTRNWDKQELDYLEEKKINYYSMNEILKKGMVAVIDEILSSSDYAKNIYLSIDIDAVDPVEAIGTGYLEHGGLSSRELIYCVQEIAKSKRLLAADIVEVNPSKDIKNMTSKLAAKLVFELADF